MFYNKRGQFYFIISVIVALAVFGITTKPNEVEEALVFQDFESLSNNYIQESEYVINDALEEKSNVEDNLNDFTVNYLEYAKQREPNLELLYVYSNGTDIKLINHFNTGVNVQGAEITGSGEQLDQDIFINVAGKSFSYKVPVRAENFGYSWYSEDVPNSFDLSVGGFLHTFNLDGDHPELEVIMNLPEGQGSYVYPGSDEYDILQGSPPLISNQVKVRP